MKVDAQGQKQWDRSYGTAQEDYLASLSLTADGGCLFGGNDYGTYTITKLNALGQKQWERTLQAGDSYTQLTQVRGTADGGYLLGGMSTGAAVGDKSEPSRGGELYGDYWVVKLAPDVLANHPSASRSALGVYPNPARGSFTVQLAADTPRAGLQLNLVDMVGRTVWHQASATMPFQVPAESLPAGVYWLRLSGPQGYQATQRVVLE